jgi:hypothetical protein
MGDVFAFGDQPGVGRRRVAFDDARRHGDPRRRGDGDDRAGAEDFSAHSK